MNTRPSTLLWSRVAADIISEMSADIAADISRVIRGY